MNLKKSIEDKTQNIPEENLVEPKLHVVGPAIEASKYYIDSEELREMFSSLISASIDNRKSDLVHPSFVELIKQLSPLDAQNLKLFKGVYQFPICEYRGVTKKDKAYITRYTNVFLQNPKVSDHNLISSSMSNLDRLGLIYISYSNFISDETFYDKFKNTSIYKKLKHEIGRNGDESLEIRKGLTQPTPIGNDFIKICLS
ncbi:DUF4393 domain-containing protein [Geomicrobium sp. JCM 19055]|uniref:DUF4393 domain-containing protein n=1 Tax=Geomicrobium sp. JCM 19055 TaxID=1460649 RepID=UPI00045ECDD5|nr:DUF4393 domain-containing protein [Geomicrobium sp. JCM 19055]GAK01493.1 phage protein [Geomicrobium sp. JCM 19055]